MNLPRTALVSVGILAAVSACAWYEAMLSRAVPDTRIRLQPGQVMMFSRVSRRNSAGQHMDEYRCGTEEIMYCESFGVMFECRCVGR
jgi:hypothetical protein